MSIKLDLYLKNQVVLKIAMQYVNLHKESYIGKIQRNSMNPLGHGQQTVHTDTVPRELDETVGIYW